MIYKLREAKYIKDNKILSDYLNASNNCYLDKLLKGLSNISKVQDGSIVNILDYFQFDEENQFGYLIVENDLGAFIIREDNIEYLEETKDVLEKYGFTKIIHNGAKTILIGDDNQKWITTKQKEDRSDLEKAVMIVLLKAEGYSVQDIYSIIELARNTKR